MSDGENDNSRDDYNDDDDDDDDDDAWFFQVVLEQDGDAAKLRHQHPHAGDVERQGVTLRHRHRKERHQSARRVLRVRTSSCNSVFVS